MERKLAVSLTAVILLLMVLGHGCKAPVTEAPAEEPRYGGRLTLASYLSIPIFDSAYCSGLPNLGIIHLVTEGLVKVDPDGHVSPHLAESWKADGRVWTINLRQGVLFHDGTPFNAEAVKFNVERMLAPETQALTRASWTMIQSVDVVDEYTVRITTHEPYGPLMAQLGYSPMAMNSPSQVQKLGNTDYHTAPVGTGPFKFVEHVRGSHTLLRRNDDYWGGRPYLDEVYAIYVPEDSARVMALETGDVDVAYNLLPHDAARLRANPELQVIELPGVGSEVLGINVTRGPLKDYRVRQALNYAVNKEAIVSGVFAGSARVMDSPLAKDVFGYHPTRTYECSPEKARQLLREAGYPDGFEAALYYSPSRLLADEVAEAIQSDLAKVGVKITLVPLEWATLTAETRKPADQSPDMYMLGWGAPTLDADLTLGGFQTGAALNQMHYSNPQVDELLLRGRQTADPQARLEAYRKAQEIIMEDCPWIFLYNLSTLHAARADVRGLDVRSSWMIYLDKTWLNRP